MYYFNQLALRDTLKAERITQAEAADAAGISLTAFKSYAKNQRSVPMKVVVDVAALLGIAPSKLLGASDPRLATMDLAKALGISVEDYGKHVAA